MRLLTKCMTTFLLIGFVLALTSSAQGNSELAGQALVGALRAGGYNIYFRHAATDWSRSDHVTAAGDWTSCDPLRMRQLAPAGRRTARRVGAAIRALRIPIGHIFASPYCRTLETARLLELGPVESTTDIMNTRVASFFGGTAAIAERARQRLSMRPATGANTVLVAHGNVLRAATTVYPKEAEAIVFRPQGSRRFVVVARVTPEQWVRFAAEFANRR